MHDHPLVFVSVWLALAGWFVGSFARALTCCVNSGVPHYVYRFAWLFGGLMVTVHIVLSYWLVYDWNHAEAYKATAEESERVTGIRAGWGVYVNFVFAAIWMFYSIAMIARRSRLPRIDQAVFWFTAAIIASATIVFENGWVRWISAAGFVALLILSALGKKQTNKNTRGISARG